MTFATNQFIYLPTDCIGYNRPLGRKIWYDPERITHANFACIMRYGRGRVIFSNAIHTLLRKSLNFATSTLKAVPRIRIAEHTELL